MELQEQEEQQYFAEYSPSSVLVRIAGVIFLLVFFEMAVLFLWTDWSEIIEWISDVRFTIPMIVSAYLLRPLFQFLALILFSGIGTKLIRVGFSWQNISPFVVARRPFELKKYRIYLLFPFVFMSFIPFVLYFVFPIIPVYIASVCLGAFCINDLMSIIRSYKFKSYFLAADHPKTFGFVLYENPFHNI